MCHGVETQPEGGPACLPAQGLGLRRADGEMRGSLPIASWLPLPPGRKLCFTVCCNEDLSVGPHPASPGICSHPERGKPWRLALMFLIPGACRATPDCAFKPLRGDLLAGQGGGLLY